LWHHIQRSGVCAFHNPPLLDILTDALRYSAKRYERLLKANGIPLPSQRGKDGEPATPTPKKRSKPAATDGEDDEESPSKKPRAKKVAMKKVDQDESDAIKNEEED